MRSWKLLAILAVSPVLSLCAFAQAAAEAVITHGAAAAAGTSGGTILGRAANQMGEKLGQQTVNAIAHPAQNPSRPRPLGQRKLQPGVVQARPGNGSLVVSIEGAEHEQSLCRPASSQPATTNPTTCKAPEVPPRDNYPSVINLNGGK